MTIRRDLKSLQQAGYLTLTHGGAIYDGDTFQQSETHHIERATIHAGRNAPSGDMSLKYSSTMAMCSFSIPAQPCAHMIPFLKDRSDLTPPATARVRWKRCIDIWPDSAILCTGGLLGAGAQSFVGPVAERFFEDFFARKAFISASASPATPGWVIHSCSIRGQEGQ